MTKQSSTKKPRHRKPPTFANNKFFPMSHGAIASKKFKLLPPAAKILYLHLCQLRNTYNQANPTSDFSFWCWENRLVELTNLSVASIRRARKQLMDAHLVAYSTSYRKKPTPPTYTICDDLYLAQMDAYNDPDCLDLTLVREEENICIEYDSQNGWLDF